MLFTCVSLISFITVCFVFLSLGIVDYEYFWQSVCVMFLSIKSSTMYTCKREMDNVKILYKYNKY